MKKITLEKKIELITAYAEGKAVEVYDKDSDEWFAKEYDAWDFDGYNYRIKPDETAPKFKVGDVLVFIGDVNTAGITTYEITEVKQGYYLFNNTSRRPIEEVEKEYISERDVLWYFEFYDYYNKEYSLSSSRKTMKEADKDFSPYIDAHSWQPMYALGFKLKES